MKTRRFSLTKSDAVSVKLALRVALNEIERMPQKDPYIQWQQVKMEELLKTLQDYKWEVN